MAPVILMVFYLVFLFGHNQHLEAEEKLQALDREQMALLDLLAERQEEGERLKRLLTV